MTSAAITVNGTRFSVREDQLDWSLLEFLRNECHLTSMKDACSPQGQCGACTVRVGDAAKVSCATKVSKALGSRCSRWRGSTPVERELLGRSYAKSGAVQCGFCIPGLVMRTKVLLDEKPNATREELARGIDLHICRCTGYAKVLDAMELAGTTGSRRRCPICL